MGNCRCGMVLLNTNDGERTNKLIECIKSYNSISRIVIVDNCSIDGSYELLKSHLNSKITIVKTDANKGYSYGNNIGIKNLMEYGDIDVVAIANTDIEFDEELILEALSNLENRENIGVIAGVQITPQKEIAPHPFWELKATWKDCVYNRMGGLAIIRRLFDIRPDAKYVNKMLNENTSIFEVGAVEGSFFFIRSKLFEDIGLFDENVFLYCEEDIMAKKIANIPYCICVDPKVTYIHYGGQTTKTLFSDIKKIKLENKAKQYYLKTYVNNNPFVLIIHSIICKMIVFESYLRNIKNRIVTIKQKI